MKKMLILGLSLILVVVVGLLTGPLTKAQNTNSSEIIYDVKTLFVSDTLAAVSWRVRQPADALVEYGNTSGQYGSATESCGMVIQKPSPEIDTWLKIENLTPGTKYYYRIKAIDEAGNLLGYSEEKNFTTKSEVKINYIAPTTGWEGTELIILGYGFGDYDPLSSLSGVVYIGNKNISNYFGNADIISWKDKEIKAKVKDQDDPFSSPKTGKVNIYRTIRSGYCYTMPVGVPVLDVYGPTFTIADHPKITSISPISGPVGTEVTINGTNFRDYCGGGHGCNTWVYFGNGYVTNHHLGTIPTWTDTKIVAMVPENATTGTVRVAMYYDSNDIDPGGDIISYNVAGPTFTLTQPVTNVNQNVNVLPTNVNANVNLNKNVNAVVSSNVENKYGCNFSTTKQDDTTIKVKKLFTKDSDMDKYLNDVYNAYKDTWGRYPRCGELQFHLDHSTPLERLQNWLNENITQTQTGDDYMEKADIKLVEKANVIELKESTKKLEFKKNDEITFSGIATPNSTVLITVSSEKKIYTTKTNNEGHWTYTITDPLEIGSHTASVEVFDQSGNKISESKPITFTIVATAKAAEVIPTTKEEKDVTAIWLTIAIGMAIFILLVIFLVSKKKSEQMPPEKKK